MSTQQAPQETTSKDANRKPARNLAVRYVFALSLVAALIVAGQVLVQLSLMQQERDARTINIAGRQRMLSQRIHVHVLTAERESDVQRLRARATTLAMDLDLWQRSHAGLRHGDVELGLPGNNSPETQALFAKLEPHFAAIKTTADRVVVIGEAANATPIDLRPQIGTLVLHVDRFLETMDRIVHVYEQEAAARVAKLQRIEVLLMVTALLVLALEALFIFRPAVRRIRAAISELNRVSGVFQQLSLRDDLTGVPNRRCFDVLYEREIRRAMRSCQPLSLIMIDVNNFKEFNDNLGHQFGDTCLSKIARTLRRGVLRPGDLVARFGGDEFVVLLPNTDMHGAQHVASAMRRAVDKLKIEHDSPHVPRSLSISTGVASATLTPTTAMPVELLRTADAALFRAKRSRTVHIPDTSWNAAELAVDQLGAGRVFS